MLLTSYRLLEIIHFRLLTSQFWYKHAMFPRITVMKWIFPKIHFDDITILINISDNAIHMMIIPFHL